MTESLRPRGGSGARRQETGEPAAEGARPVVEAAAEGGSASAGGACAPPLDGSSTLESGEARPLSRLVLGQRVDATSYAAATGQVLDWARRREPRYVCISTVHMVMEGHDDPGYRAVVNAADLITPDGMPLVWALRRLGVPGASRVCGPHLTPAICEAAAREGVAVGFYGGEPEVVGDLLTELARRYPGLEVAYSYSPPFRRLSEDEDARVVADIEASGVRVLFVGLGCPKQERWMYEHRDRIGAVMLGVGAAFDFIAGRKAQAPRFMQDAGLEWLFRLGAEPRRLWRRYLYHNPRFVVLLARQLLAERAGRAA